MQALKERTSTTSCTECQRRKQKCSREWPCNHCQARKVPHLCQFAIGQKKSQQASPSEISRYAGNPVPITSSQQQGGGDVNMVSFRDRPSDARGQKRSLSDSGEASSLSQDSGQDEPEDAIKLWGYMPGHVHYDMNHLDFEVSRQKESSCESDKSDDVEKVLFAIPPRSITDAFVNHFLTVVNHRYSAIYAPAFTDKYVQWWADRASGRRLSPEFTCLLLRVLSYSVQYLTVPLRKMIEFELACTSQVLTDRFSDAAEQLSQSFSASETSLERVQEGFLKGAWLKSESRIVESWHALSCTIREAQELGIDKESSSEDLSQFDIEIRRRLWAILFIWDWQISAWLGRPHLIDQKDLSFVFPTLRLDQSTDQPNHLSPFAHMALAAHLFRRLAPHLGDVKATKDISATQVTAILAEIDMFTDELPPVFRMNEPDLSLDDQYPHYVFQRLQLHSVIYVTKFDFLKPYLAGDPRKPKNCRDAQFRNTGVDLALELLKQARLLFDHEFPINVKFHMVVFVVFDTATILCSAVIHDVEHRLHRREEVMDSIDNALNMLQQLSFDTKVGAASYRFLTKLVQATPALARHSPISKRQRLDSKSVPTPGNATPAQDVQGIAESIEPAAQPAVEEVAVSNSLPVPGTNTTDDLSFDLDQFMAQNPFGAADQLDIGGLEAIWDWDELNLNSFDSAYLDPSLSGNGSHLPGA